MSTIWDLPQCENCIGTSRCAARIDRWKRVRMIQRRREARRRRRAARRAARA